MKKKLAAIIIDKIVKSFSQHLIEDIKFGPKSNLKVIRIKKTQIE